jgi:hypothetical protein
LSYFDAAPALGKGTGFLIPSTDLSP